MILEGKVIRLIGEQEGISKTTGNPWKLAQYLLETDEQYPKKVCVDVFGEDRINELSLIPDEQVRLHVDVESREFNGRWYTSVRAWGRAENPAESVDRAEDSAESVEQPVEENSKLPF